MNATDCQSCHARPANHWQGQCSGCHNTSNWKSVNFNHALVGATDCQSCHTRPANHFQGQCSTCHTTNAWKPATFTHSFPMNHGGANGVCSACHTNGGNGPADCFLCHNRAELDRKHAEERITDYASHCLDCHPGGRGGD